MVKRNAKGHSTRGVVTRGHGENDNGTRRLQLPKTTNMGETTGIEDPRPIAAGLTVSNGAWDEFAMCASCDEKVYEFSVPIQSGRYHMVGVAPEACCADVSKYHSFTPKQLVETGNETLLGQWGLLRTRNGEGHLGWAP